HPNSIVPLLRQLLSDAGIDAVEAFSSHSLRRGFATWASASGWEIKALMEYVGWRDTQTALRYIEAKSPFEQALVQIPTEVASSVGQPRLAGASQLRLRALTVQLTLEPQRPRSRKHYQARTVIEAHCLKPFEVEHQTDGHYRIEVPATSDEHLDETMDDLIDEIHRIASDKACWVETLITDPATGQTWD
ncbi:tyrosine-type recombinase/integrase, partial [Marinobacter sp. UBA2678]